MPSIFKKLVLSFLSFLILFFSIAPSLAVKASIPTPQNDPNNIWIHQWYGESNMFAWYQKVYDTNTSPASEIFGERYTAAQVQWVIYGLASMLLNIIPGNPDLINFAINGDVNSMFSVVKKVQDGILQTMNPISTSSPNNNSNLAVSVANTIGQSPISGIAYFKDVASRFTLVSTVHAQGFGYNNAGNSMMDLWRITRNISFGLIILATIVLAFMIMFRVKISPQVVISVQSAIPKLVITLLLITFSYAIAGFAIDLMYVVIGLIAGALSSGRLSGDTAAKVFADFTNSGGYNAIGLLWLYWLHFFASTFASIFTGPGITTPGSLPWGIFAFLFSIIVLLAMLWWTVKIIWMLIQNFAMIMITIAIGPLEILLGSVTGAVGFASWFKKLITYLAVYPVVCLFFFLAFFFLNQGGSGGAVQTRLMPFAPTQNLIGANGWLPPLSIVTDSGYSLIWVLVSFFIFSEITHIPKMIESLMNGKPWAFGSGMGEVRGSVNVVGGVAESYGKSLNGKFPGPILSGIGSALQRIR